MFVYVNAHMITISSTDDNNYSMTVNSRFQGLVCDLQVCFWKTAGCPMEQREL